MWEEIMKTDKQDKALDQVLADIEKQFGKGSIMKLGSDAHLNIEATSSGSIALDVALGVGGYPKGRIVEIYGPESSGKTTFALHAIAEVQKKGGRAAFIDAEHALDPVYAQNLGVDLDNLLLSQPDTGEQALDICEALVKSGVIDLVVIDSVAALVPQAEIEGEMGDAHVGLQARLMSQALRKLSGVLNKSKTTAIFINQLREKVGVLFGNPETTPGGRALKFYSTIRLEVRRAEQIKQGDKVIGNRTNIKVVKNKVAPPFRTAMVDIMYGEGVSKEGEMVDLAAEIGILEKSGAWYSYNGEKVGQGRENVKILLKENTDLRDEFEYKIREHYGILNNMEKPKGSKKVKVDDETGEVFEEE
jgi:recombination protein RecA